MEKNTRKTKVVSTVYRVIGNGQDSSLWGDNWLGNGLLRNLYPDVYILNLQQRASINEGMEQSRMRPKFQRTFQ
ncbi:hypothetical protein H5410_005572 [Solanum commersonii]|uniref:Uncharacterized protein n=1 Tax=Solanum commersonii TaxID=4109 RepID=A0A9J6A7Q6_SOLCO|nr:hypothetical protein H5410_005572 [Solanum commersonii]